MPYPDTDQDRLSVTNAVSENLPHHTSGLQRVRRFRSDARWLVSIHERPISRSWWTGRSELEQPTEYAGLLNRVGNPLQSRDWLAGAEGIEPSNAGIKIQCLTTWRRPTRVAPYKASRAPPQTGPSIGQMPGQTRVLGPVAGLGGHRYKDASRGEG
jgi:hypothetical protein